MHNVQEKPKKLFQNKRTTRAFDTSIFAILVVFAFNFVQAIDTLLEKLLSEIYFCKNFIFVKRHYARF